MFLKREPLDILLKKVTTPHEEPQAGWSGGVPKEGTCILEDKNTMHVIALEDFIVGQDMEVGDSDIEDTDPV